MIRDVNNYRGRDMANGNILPICFQKHNGKNIAWAIQDPHGELDASVWRTRVWAARWAKVIGGRYWHKKGYEIIKVAVEYNS